MNVRQFSFIMVIKSFGISSFNYVRKWLITWDQFLATEASRWFNYSLLSSGRYYFATTEVLDISTIVRRRTTLA
jgi:hypothetical protein